ncbi:PQQ-dependent sugar dehydrogenase [Dokdonella immobilis]|uniref:Glucose/arabinose dehydrogenase, beta-propeller fold n=1 Tax=Dokdonella immobilis TaxID=578942 RepID=A0A1I5AMD4_9GAMM|nr:PQQ-dependent sugar dehydrogenase [Dokdonella immobilis]SFN63631.1 Glucose/arabinose dehydrogenase, beta-propeller fold [Dokdonella immobilis]
MRWRPWLFLLPALAPAGAIAQSWPTPNFRHTVAIAGRNQPTQLRFAHDGRVFVAEKSGALWMYRNLLDTAPEQIANLAEIVHQYQDRGLLGLALDPRFPERPYLYVLYSFNGGLFADSPPRWPATSCPNPTADFAGCVISGRLSRLTLAGNLATDEHVLIEDWYQQYPSHSVGTVRFGADGFLYVGGGDGASYLGGDWGQRGNPDWPDQRSPVDQGGALRAQGLEVEKLYTDQVWLNGTIARVDPASGDGAPGNPLANVPGATPNARRILAYGLRNPFRFTMRPGTSEVWIGDVGWRTWEEINVIPDPADGSALRNFGWPCFENHGHVSEYTLRPLCLSLYAGGDSGGRTPASPPFYAYQHTSGNAISGIAFYPGGTYPAEYRNALFFADYTFNRIWVIRDTNGDGRPDPVPDSGAEVFGQSSLPVVDLTTGPGGDLFYVDIDNGRIVRISWDADTANRNLAPSAAIALDDDSDSEGPPRTIEFTAANSIDPESQALTYAWDLDGDGDFDDATGVSASRDYVAGGPAPELISVSVRVTDSSGAADVARTIVTVARDPLFSDGFDAADP